MEINIVDEYEKINFSERKLDSQIQEYFDFLEAQKCPVYNEELQTIEISAMAITVVFCDNSQIQELNSEFREINKPTDVLTFPENGVNNYLGDIIISLDKVEEQAIEYNHSFERELFFLLTHGYLHLLGYDHKEREEEKIMFTLQEKLLYEYGIERGKDE